MSKITRKSDNEGYQLDLRSSCIRFRFAISDNACLLSLDQVGYNPEDVIFVPISALNRDNLVDPSPRMAWFRGWTKGEASGMTLLEAMDRVEPPVPPVDRPLRLPLQDVYKIDQIGTVPVGKVEAGKIRAGMKVKFAPSGLVGEVVRVEKEHTVVEQGIPGDSVGFPVTEISVKDIRRGYVCSDAENCPAKTAASFVAQVPWIISTEGVCSFRCGPVGVRRSVGTPHCRSSSYTTQTP